MLAGDFHLDLWIIVPSSSQASFKDYLQNQFLVDGGDPSGTTFMRSHAAFSQRPRSPRFPMNLVSWCIAKSLVFFVFTLYTRWLKAEEK